MKTILSAIALCLLSWSSIAANTGIVLYLKNSTASTINGTSYRFEINGTSYASGNNVNVSVGATTAVFGPVANSALIGGTLECFHTVSGTNIQAFAATSSPTYDGGLGTSFTITASGNYVFEVGAAAPVVQWRYDLVLRNDTYARQTYYLSTNSVQTVTFALDPGSTSEISYRSNLVRFPISISNGGIYPPFALEESAESEHWTLEDSIPVAETVLHSMLGQGSLPSTNAMMTQIFTNAIGSTNAATDGTLAAGFILIGGQLNQYGERQIELLEQMATNFSVGMGTNGQGFVDESDATNDLTLAAISDAVFLNSGFIAGSNAIVGATASINAITNMETSFGHLDDFWVVSFKEPGHPLHFELDLRPTSHSWMANLAAWIKGLITWTAAMIVLYLMFIWTKEYAQAQGAFHIGRSPITRRVSGAGAQAKSIWSSLFTHGLIFVVIAAISVAFMVVFVAYITGTKGFPDLVDIVTTNPFYATDESIVEGLWLLSVFVDVPALIMLFILCIAYNSFLIVHSVAVQMMMRATPGAIVFCFLHLHSADAAAELQLQNVSGSTLYLGGIGTEAVLEQGQILTRRSFAGPEIEVRTNSGGSLVTNWINAFTSDDAKVWVTFAAGSGSIEVLQEETGTVWSSFNWGLKVGGALMSIACVMWLLKIIIHRSPERALE